MHKYTRMKNSRNSWKDKARDRADELRESRKRESRKDNKIERLELELERSYQLVGKKKSVRFSG